MKRESFLREMMLDEPMVSAGMSNFFAVGRPVVIDVLYGQKLRPRFAAASTLVPVRLEYFRPEPFALLFHNDAVAAFAPRRLLISAHRGFVEVPEGLRLLTFR